MLPGFEAILDETRLVLPAANGFVVEEAGICNGFSTTFSLVAVVCMVE